MVRDIKEIETLRKEAFNIDETKLDAGINSFYEKQIDDNKILPIGGYVNDKLVAGIYISAALNSLFIEQLFVKKEYRHNGYGKQIVKFVLDNKHIFEEFFKQEFDFSKAEIRNNDALKLVENLGYSETNDIYGTFRKRI